MTMRRGFQLVQEMTWYYGWSGQDRSMWLEDREDEKQMDARLARLNEWFAAEGGLGFVEVRRDDYSGRCGVYATTAIETGAPYVVVPRHLLMDRGAAMASADGAAYARGEAAVDALTNAPASPSWMASTITLCTRLAVERSRGADSPMAPYVDALPRSFAAHPLLWRNRTGDAALRGTYLLDCIKTQRTSLRTFVALARACRDGALPPLSRGDLAWSYLCWMTRCIGVVGAAADGQTAWAFVPVVDMTNCAWSPHAACTRTLWDGRSGRRGAAVMRTPCELAEGAQVFENYGWSNFDYAVAHGFMLPFGACPKDCLIARPRPVDVDAVAGPLVVVALGHPPQEERIFGPPRAEWRPRLNRSIQLMRLKAAPETPADRADDDEAETLWAAGKNASLVVAVALELPTAALRRAAKAAGPEPTLEAVEAALFAVATPPPLARAWRVLADIAAGVGREYEAAAARDDAADADDAEATLARAWRDDAIKLAVEVEATYREEARRLDAEDPPEYR